jgi:RNA polymerase sigma-70 factor (ECF subfamily)
VSLEQQLGNQEHRQWVQSVFDRLQRPLVAYCGRLLNKDWDRAHDCVQEAFVRLCHSEYSAVESYVDAWLFKTCRNIVMDIHRQESRMGQRLETEVALQVRSREPDPTEKVARDEECAALEGNISQLPPLEREALSLRLGQGLSYKQIAEVMEVSVSHVGVLLHQALGRLRGSMSKTSGVRK